MTMHNPEDVRMLPALSNNAAPACQRLTFNSAGGVGKAIVSTGKHYPTVGKTHMADCPEIFSFQKNKHTWNACPLSSRGCNVALRTLDGLRNTMQHDNPCEEVGKTGVVNPRSCETLSRMASIDTPRANLKTCIIQVNMPRYGYP